LTRNSFRSTLVNLFDASKKPAKTRTGKKLVKSVNKKRAKKSKKSFVSKKIAKKEKNC